MKKFASKVFLALCLLAAASGFAQDSYRYAVNLEATENDRLHVRLQAPVIQSSTVTFAFPKIIPGTYAIADYGKFIFNVKAFDKNGKGLPVSRISDNQWRISSARSLQTVTYEVEDIFDAGEKHNIYPMAATNIEAGKNFVLNTPGVFGYFDGMRTTPFEISFTKPSGFYASTSVAPVSTTATSDIFRFSNIDLLYDAPIMYGRPDTTTVTVGNCQVLVSVFSPNGLIQSREVAGWLSELLEAARQYLGGKLPADRYAFLYYFKDPKLKHSFPAGLGGALEHTTSSFYYLPEAPAAALRKNIVDISSHEFFHIITPLTIASREVKEFNFNEAVLSRHLWLYEGVTEYTSHHVQVKHGLNSVTEFLNKLSQKITASRTQYNDSLSFTELSVHSAGKWAAQYGNVYDKGALIAACLDIYLLHLSNGSYGLRNLTYDLGVRFGRNRAFNDTELFDHIAELSFPEVKDFLVKHVQGGTPIPYEYYFGLAGIRFTPRLEQEIYSFGNIQMVPGKNGVVVIGKPFAPNEFGKKLGYQAGDEIYAFNGVAVDAGNLGEVIPAVRNAMREGETFRVKIGRRNAGGGIDTLQLSAPVMKVKSVEINKLAPVQGATEKQKLVFASWLTNEKPAAPRPAADPADVASIDAIVRATYEVISGDAGPRNWNRFQSLFFTGGAMGAIAATPAGPQFKPMTPEAYQKGNAPFFQQSGFYEEELKRNVRQFGNVAMVESAYQFRLEKGGKVEQRGINYFTLVRSGGRWWITSLVWQDETKDLPLPKDMH